MKWLIALLLITTLGCAVKPINFDCDPQTEQCCAVSKQFMLDMLNALDSLESCNKRMESLAGNTTLTVFQSWMLTIFLVGNPVPVVDRDPFPSFKDCRDEGIRQVQDYQAGNIRATWSCESTLISTDKDA